MYLHHNSKAVDCTCVWYNQGDWHWGWRGGYWAQNLWGTLGHRHKFINNKWQYILFKTHFTFSKTPQSCWYGLNYIGQKKGQFLKTNSRQVWQMENLEWIHVVQVYWRGIREEGKSWNWGVGGQDQWRRIGRKLVVDEGGTDFNISCQDLPLKIRGVDGGCADRYDSLNGGIEGPFHYG